MSRFTSAVLFAGSVLVSTQAFGITLGQIDDFNDTTTQGWVSGLPNPVPPVNVLDVGQLGVGDHVLQVSSTGAFFGAGSQPTIFNNAQWAGDYLAAGVNAVTLDINNLSNVAINPGFEVRGPGGNLFTLATPTVPANSGWQSVTISLDPGNLTGFNVLTTLAAVTELRIRNIVGGAVTLPFAATTAYYDNIKAELVGDYNGDGFVGVDDLNIVLIHWNQNVTPGDLLLGDGTGEGFVGVDDLNIILVNWNTGTPPADGAAIPEPASLAMLGLGACALLRRRR